MLGRTPAPVHVTTGCYRSSSILYDLNIGVRMTAFAILWVLALCFPISALSSPSIVSSGNSGHSNNWAVLLGTSKYWFNYRHNANALSLYRTIRRLGIPDDQILLMLPEDTACSPRNPFPGRMFNSPAHDINLYASADEEYAPSSDRSGAGAGAGAGTGGGSVEVDYRGDDVTVEAVLRLLAGRHPKGTPRAKKLRTDDRSNVLIYMSGHGGDQFLKIRDSEVLSAQDISAALDDMHAQKRYNEVLLLVDTCQAATLPASITAPNILTLSSSALGENSYSHSADPAVGNSLIDKFTYYALEFFENRRDTVQNATMADFFNTFTRSRLHATPVARTDLYPRPLSSVPVTDFFGTTHSTDAIVPLSLPSVPAPVSAGTRARARARARARTRARTRTHSRAPAHGGPGPEEESCVVREGELLNCPSLSAAAAAAAASTVATVGACFSRRTVCTFPYVVSKGPL